MVLRISANLGYLWTELPLPERITAAARAGFDAVECHFPYDVPPRETAQALTQTGLAMVSLNTRRGRPGELGLAAIADAGDRARTAIDEAVAYARAVACDAVHVMAGKAVLNTATSEIFAGNLAYACRLAPEKTILIEPLNPRDAPGYALGDLETAVVLVDRVGASNLKIMFDCYHMQITGGDLLSRFRTHLDLIGHVQFAGVPDRGRPDRGEVNYAWLLPAMQDAGYTGAFGAEYRPVGAVEDGLGWLDRLRN